MRGYAKAVLLAFGGLVLAGCTTTTNPASLAANDPYEPTNRAVFRLNQKLDKYFVLPTAGFYVWAVPEFGRNRIHDLLDEFSLPVTFANDLLQGETGLSKETFERFMINATLGVGGLFDPASAFHVPDHGADFGQTLGVWGVREGPYWVLPLLGPDPPRDAFGRVADYYIDPSHWIHYKQHIWWDGAHLYFTLLDVRARNIQTVQSIQRSSVDFYASTRSLYRQLRNAQIRHGKPDVGNLPKF